MSDAPNFCAQREKWIEWNLIWKISWYGHGTGARCCVLTVIEKKKAIWEFHVFLYPVCHIIGSFSSDWVENQEYDSEAVCDFGNNKWRHS